MRIISIYFFLICGLSIHGQQYNFINYDVQEGLPNAQVSKIFQDSKAYLWIATRGGVCKFDGANFDVLNTKNGLPSNIVHEIYEDSKKQIWIGTDKGLICQEDARVYLKERKVFSIARLEENILWIGTDKGLYVLDTSSKKGQKRRLHPALNIAKVNDMKQIGKELWLASSKGLFVLRNDKVELLDSSKGLLSDDVRSITLDKKGRVWVAMMDGGVLSIGLRSKKVLRSYSNIDLRTAQEIYIDLENRLWVGTREKGVMLQEPGSQDWTRISVSKGLSNNNVTSITSDDWGNIWIGTSGGGMNKFLGQFFTHYNSDTGLNGNRIYAVTEDRKGTIWLSVDDKGVSTIDSSGIHTDIDGDYVNSKCNHIMEDGVGRIWLSTAGGGLVMKDSNDYWVFNELDGLPSSWITATIQDTEGDIWVGTYADGLGRIVSADSLGIKVEQYGIASGLPDPFITVMSQDKTGKIWFGTKKGGIGYIEHLNIISVKEQVLPDAEISSLSFGENNEVWVGVKGYGLYQNNGEDLDFKKSPATKKLTSRNVNQLIFDQEGDLWVGTELGLDKLIFNQEVGVDVQHFGRNEGFIGVQTSPNAVAQDRNGHIWFGTQNGLSKHKPGKTQVKVAPPKIHFSDVSLMYESMSSTPYYHYVNEGDSLTEKSVFKHFENNVAFDFQALNLDYPKDLKYTWKLEGFDENWSPTSKAESANFTNLNPGKYRFKVKAVNQVGLESKVISTSFEIKPALWQSIWFQLAVLLGLALLTYLIFRNRLNKVRKREADRRAQLELENELLGLEQKALQLQMNPHFIFNALNSIQSVVVSQKTDVARDQIQNFAGLMRGILTNSKKEVIALQEEYNTLDKYLKLEQFCQTKEFDFSITLPDGHDPDEIEIPPMMIQPFVENAVFHGVSHLEEKGSINVIFEIKNELLSCIITDNGVGRQKSAALKKKKVGHQSVAIDVTQKRLESLRGQKRYKAFSIQDVLNEAGEVRGTKVTLQLPLKLTF